MSVYQDFLSEEYGLLAEKLITFAGQAYPKFGNVIIMAGGAGCYPKGTEFFTGTGWKYIEEYEDGDFVLQFDPTTDKASLTNDVDFVNLPIDQFYRIKNRRADFITSASHKHLIRIEKTDSYAEWLTTEIVDQHKTKKRGLKGSLITSFDFSGPGIDMTDDQIRLKIAVIADGYVLTDRKTVKEPKIRMKFKKDRKIARFKELLVANGIEYSTTLDSYGYSNYEFYYDNKDKEFESFWYGANKHQLQVIADEVLKWDGSIVYRIGKKPINTFNSTSKKSADFIQFVFASLGYDTSIHVDEREGRNPCYGVYINHSKGVGVSKNNRSETTTTIEPVDSVDGRMYCFTVPTGFFVVRQNNKIYVSGNSGKGFVKDKLVGAEGFTFDVDALKTMASATPAIISKVKAELGIDMTQLASNLKNPENVSKLHEIIGGYLNLDNKKLNAIYTSIMTAAPDRKPNLIFDVTLKDLNKFGTLTRQVRDLGYSNDRIHVVWVVNDIEIAKAQNAKRDRTVPVEILINTHRGVSATMNDIFNMGKQLKKYMDGDLVVAFNKVGVDSEIAKSGSGGMYVKAANYFYLKKAGKDMIPFEEIDKDIKHKIASYVPAGVVWEGVEADETMTESTSNWTSEMKKSEQLASDAWKTMLKYRESNNKRGENKAYKEHLKHKEDASRYRAMANKLDIKNTGFDS